MSVSTPSYGGTFQSGGTVLAYVCFLCDKISSVPLHCLFTIKKAVDEDEEVMVKKLSSLQRVKQQCAVWHNTTCVAINAVHSRCTAL